jgi:CRISPR/Cas system type I-B associated protein Csh2 (Cas7 group RAMP superfamily)
MKKNNTRDIDLENKEKDQATERKKGGYAKQVYKDWFDVCAFGQVITWRDTSIGIR